MTIKDVFEHPENFNFNVDRLGECMIDNPIQMTNYVEEGDRTIIAHDLKYLEEMHKRGAIPTFEKAGPHRKIYHDPVWSRAAIVTCGGLCPGLNDVIKGIVQCLWFDYGVRHIFGVRYGLEGFIPKYGHEPLILDPEVVDAIHEEGGTILGSSRGGQDTVEIVRTLSRLNINMLFCIGGDGTLRAARDIAEEIERRHLKISVVGVPKTIDNDLAFVGRSFGFETAVYATGTVITAAHTEAKGAHNGIGLVKLMGRDSGFIAAYACLANSVVNMCLIPELPFELEGEHGVLTALERRFGLGKDHAVIVVAEGAGQHLIKDTDVRKDASGNVLKKDIGEFLKTKIEQHFAAKKQDVTVKYFDPSYTIRSVPAQGTDAILCYMLARGAAHAAMAGRTNCVVGKCADVFMLVPTSLATIERQKVDVEDALWQSVVDATRQGEYMGYEPLVRR
ncbi:MAG: ATP-dependent 6-phosphofructokinase [Kiritimatiellia bacterium]|jgi:6-phosphofructokinase 1|uniref:ATP-dependent 6-phosphofructokinase n=1 Tax=Atribacter sp. TaxID=2847780 RepID=UPI003D997679